MRLLPSYDPPQSASPVGAMTSTGTFVATPLAAREVLDQVSNWPVIAIAVDSEYRFRRPGVPLTDGTVWYDIRSQEPICFSVAILRPGFPISTAVFDVRVPGVAVVMEELLRLRVPFIFHNAKAELFSLWALGFDPDIPVLYDTKIAAQCATLGHLRGPRRSGPRCGAPDPAARPNGEAQAQYDVSLVGQCAHYGLGHPFSEGKDKLRSTFLDFDMSRPLTSREVEYAAADAEFTLRLYLAQRQDRDLHGLDHHLQTVEFPFIVANARIEWNGVHVDRERCRRLRSAAMAALAGSTKTLHLNGVTDPDDDTDVRESMCRAGLSAYFPAMVAIDEQVLADADGLHPAVDALRLYRKSKRLVTDDLLTGIFVGADGRFHPRHNQLGAATGRNTCTTPNVTGIGRRFRSIVTAPEGRALVELDYSQMDIGVAAAEHNDDALIAMFNEGDVYVEMAKRIFGVGQGLDPAAFKEQHGRLRDRMKMIVLSVLYGVGDESLARKLRTNAAAAAAERTRFLDLFPQLRAGIERSRRHGLSRGFATTVTGLRRQVEFPVSDIGWTKNFLANTPIQGSAAVVFKRAVVLLDQAFRGTATQIVLPIHDAVLLECRAEEIAAVSETARTLMVHAFRAVYPRLRPRVDINRADPSCWNKDGDGKSLDRFIDEHLQPGASKP